MLKALARLSEISSATTKKIERVLEELEEEFPDTWHYKHYAVKEGEKTIEWVSQQTDEYESKELADQMKEALNAKGLAKGWTLKVTVRDEWNDPKTKWHVKKKI